MISYSLIIAMFLLIYISSFIVIVRKYNKKINELKTRLFSTKENNIMRSILDSGINSNTRFTLESSALSIVNILRNNYKLDYCSILINRDKLINIASNVESQYIESIEDYCNEAIRNMNGAAKIRCSETYLNYGSANKRKIKYSYLIPLNQQSKQIGAIFIENYEDYKENQFELEFFKLVIKNIAIALQNCIYHDEITSMAMKDNLTQIYNRNYMKMHLQKQIDSNKKFTLALLDIDFFKKFNDTYGHDFGDVVLREVSQFIKKSIKEYDEIYRWGGEEFVIYFNNTESSGIYGRLNNIRYNLSRYKIGNEKSVGVSVTASFGTVDSGSGKTIDELISLADKALYHSKETGRNKVTVYEKM
ncbi:diguanylate cyclase domain protein [Clostridium argentinense CDC 2741]|uniref:Diguanylate cyclase domain protein n=1 Tax=Clostridium argentinense CDC 2741 TaxID=1418104 RepID=A0A0C1UAR3_9CLOT|nr:GGDEF domain-containing protein [Clostridium argentinense]ARC84443.1 GGDEF domain-containing protein [Clostridium argentinense]KIE44660.1 diguanylate cyclase domain protein [Clostridium argentinense CDC 2741]NFF38774.1 GGDEF domain-containing protein [Clostridium argentinense]NFP48999.1 GGDEF domain-containing protein [Clostridium argentinense]NFP72545.1 GGDEF domain-containing protein [Clostridium argentinense]